MKKLIVMTLVFSIFSNIHASEKQNCRSGYTEVSCKNVKEAKRDYFCTKKEVSEKRKLKLCSKAKKRKARKRS